VSRVLRPTRYVIGHFGDDIVDGTVTSEQLFVVDASLSGVSSSPLCRRNQKLSNCQRTSEAVLTEAQAKNLPSVKVVVPVSGTSDIQGVTETSDLSERLRCESARTDIGSSDDVRMNSGVGSKEPRTDSTATTATTSSADNSSPDVTPSEGNSADKVERLRKMIDRATGQLYTIAEVYLMMMKPSRVPLEYDWVDTSADNVATDNVSGRLRKLVSIAKAAFTASTAKPLVSLNTTSNNVLLVYFSVVTGFGSVVSTLMGYCLQAGKQPTTQVNSAWPSLYEYALAA